MSSYNVGDEVVLLNDYNGYPKGTKCLYIGHTRDSGAWVPVVVIPDANYTCFLQANNVSYLKSLIDIRPDILETRYLEIYLTNIKPDPHMIISLEEADNKLASAKKALAEAQEQRDLFKPLNTRVESTKAIFDL